MADDQDSAPQLPAPARPPAPITIAKMAIALSLITVLGVAAGGFLGLQTASSVKAAIEAKVKPPELPSVRYSGALVVKDLPPIVTNLADGANTFVRFEASVVLDAKAVPHPEVLIAEINGDVLAFLRTLTMAQIQGASGLRQLREDLNERVAIRSEGHVRELIIQTLVVQ